MGNISFRPKENIPERLDQMAALLDRNRSWIINEALDDYLARHARYIAEVNRRIDFADANPDKLISNDEVMSGFMDKINAIKPAGQ